MHRTLAAVCLSLASRPITINEHNKRMMKEFSFHITTHHQFLTISSVLVNFK
jgi:hypothetical protein